MKKLLTLIVLLFASVAASFADGRVVSDLSGAGWRLWQDKNADWRNEKIFMTPVDISQVPVHEPTDGWAVLASPQAMAVNVPGSAEEYLQTVSGPDGDISGVTWWSRTIDVPRFEGRKVVKLCFGSIRNRAEIFVNRRLVDYQIVDNTPFEVDITEYVNSGQKAELAVRITDAGGNYDWRDSATIPWDGKLLPPGHAFGGVTGRVSLQVTDPVYVSDIYMQNTPKMTAANAIFTIENNSGKTVKRDITIKVADWKNRAEVIFSKELKAQTLRPGANEITVAVDAPQAKLWDVENPNLYVCNISLSEKGGTTDLSTKRFGFRWFDVSGIGEDAVFRLNGKRIVLRSAISWSFWPINGIYPTDELARRQVTIAKTLGLNMLNFHRFIGFTNVLDAADELGLLYYEEPGGFRAVKPGEDFLNANLFEKVHRMVMRDRSHPSLIIFNMMNESGAAPEDKLAIELQAMRNVRKLDPTRIVTRTSGWAAADYVDDQAKIHMRPMDTTIYRNGWYDYHRAGGPAVWHQELYQSPDNYYNNTSNRKEIVFFGEEGAISSPPRLELNKRDLDKAPYKGWDGREFLRWYDEFENFLNRKGLRDTYPTVDTLNVAMGRVSFEHQGRKIELARMNDATDGYVVNGWESELIENFSGIVDCFRYPKSTPEIIAKYNRPLYVAVKLRKQVALATEVVTGDFYIVNEKDLKGAKRLEVKVFDAEKRLIFETTENVKITGGEKYGELIAKAVKIGTGRTSGLRTVEATIKNPDGTIAASGSDQLLVINNSENTLGGRGAVWEEGATIRTFLTENGAKSVEKYSDDSEKLDWVVVSRPPRKEQFVMVPTEAFVSTGGASGVDAEFFTDMQLGKSVHKEVMPFVNLAVTEGAIPNPSVPTVRNYSVRYSGMIVPPADGEYVFNIQTNDRSTIKVTVDGKEIRSYARSKPTEGDGKVTLTEGKAVPFTVEFLHASSNARCCLEWAVPYDDMPDPAKLMERAKNDGTRIIILENADNWMEFITAANPEIKYRDKFYVGIAWLGGVMFNKPHSVFKGLPQGDVLNWPYQALIHTGTERMGLRIEGEELLVGAYHTYPMDLGTAMGIVPMGNGQVLFSTLDIVGNITNQSSAALTGRKLLLNMIDWGSER